jgi:hypothetical protein
MSCQCTHRVERSWVKRNQHCDVTVGRRLAQGWDVGANLRFMLLNPLEGSEGNNSKLVINAQHLQNWTQVFLL